MTNEFILKVRSGSSSRFVPVLFQFCANMLHAKQLHHTAAGLILLQGLVVRPLLAHLSVTAHKERQHFDLLLPDLVLKNSLILVFFKKSF